MANKPRGVFVNTARASCSIHESGRMVYRCLALCQDVELDYYSLDSIDIDAFIASGELRLKPGIEGEVPRADYDFWVFNWHFVTMAMHLDPAVIARIPAPKFTVVLELAPGDPLQLVPPNVFDAYIALDPGAEKTETIYPFPRPLDGAPRTQTEPPRDVPVIGSFGFPTPGKGFDVVVAAVNAEFERAIVRINAPAGDFVFTDAIHRTNYARYLEDLCRRVAKPGIEVRFSYGFLTPDELVDWCSENDLNCFMYNRAQPGLSATTDQAIISGRPLVTSSNDTFRHIHQYIPPYPLTSLRAALKESKPKVEAMQRDWSREAFNVRFSGMLRDFGVLQGEDEGLAPVTAPAFVLNPSRVLVATAGLEGHGLYDRTHRTAAALGRTGEYQVRIVEIADCEALAAAIAEDAPDAVLIADPHARLADAQVALAGPVLRLAQGAAAQHDDNTFVLAPVIPYQTVAGQLRPVPNIWLIGFAGDAAAARAMLQRIAGELPDAQVKLQLLPGATSADRSLLESVLDEIRSLEASIEAIPPTGEIAITQYAEAHLILVRSDARCADHLQNVAELAMITERAVALSAEAPFPAFGNKVTRYEQHTLAELIAMGAAAQIEAMMAFGEGAAYARLHAALVPRVTGRAGARPLPAVDAPARHAAQTHAETVRALFQEHLGRGPDPTGLQHYVAQLEKGVSAKRLARDISRSAEAVAYREQRGVAGPGVSVDDLLRLRGEPFVRAAYRAVLGRDPDPLGLAHHLGLLEDGEPRESLLVGLYRSPESQLAARALPGLEALARKRRGGGMFRWLGRKQRAARFDRRAVNVLDHRVSRLQESLSELAAQPASIVVQMQAGTHAPAAPALLPIPTFSVVPAIVPGHPGGAIYLLVDPGASAADRDGALAFADAADGRPVRPVRWNARGCRFELEVPGFVPPSREPQADAAQRSQQILCIDPASIGPKDLLVIRGLASTDQQADALLETSIILEARRLGLVNAWLVDAAALAATDRSAREHQYLQSLLLTDLLIAPSADGLVSLERFFAVEQRASFAPPRAVLAAAGEGAEDDDLLPRLIDTVVRLQQASRGIEIVLASLPGDATQTSGLVEALAEIGVPVRTSSAVPAVAKTDGVQWTLTGGERHLSEVRALLQATRSNNARVALIVDDAAWFDRFLTGAESTDLIAAADMILCADQKVADKVWQHLLAARVHYPCASSRVAVLGAGIAQPHRFAARMTQLLVGQTPDAGRMPLSGRHAAALSDRPRLSVCISTYNRAGWLRKSLENIVRQIPVPRADLEILVVDNTSTDETPAVCEAFRHRPDFRILRNRTNVGMLGNLAVTAQHARGDYIWILGDDDLTRDGAIDKLLYVLDQNPSVELVYMNYGYTTESDPAKVVDPVAFLDNFNVLQEAGPDDLGTVAALAAKTENFYTAIYSHVYRRDHAIRAYCQDTSGRIFATMRACIPTTAYVLSQMGAAPAYWIGEQMLVVNSNVSWAAYGPMLDLEHLPEAWDMAERIGCPQVEVDYRRANRLWLVEMMWRQLFQNDSAGNGAYISAERVLLRLQHLDEIFRFVPALRSIYEEAYRANSPAARLEPAILFSAFADVGA